MEVDMFGNYEGVPNEQYNFNTDYCCPLTESADKEGFSLGSHYHCSQCYKLCSMMGHWRSGHFVGSRFVKSESHYCCDPVNCELRS